MTRIFISYSRKNMVFAKHLTGALQSRDIDFWVDWEGIPPTVDWMQQIQKGIEGADIFLFIISPDSIKSDVCKKELAIAVQNGKRLVPIVATEVTWDEAPSEISRLNYIFFRENDDFDAAFTKLLTAIDTDYDWVQAHRRLQVKALEWDRSSRDGGFLLRGKDLEDAEQQIVFYKLKSAQFIIEKVPTLKRTTLKLLSKKCPLYYRKGAHFCPAQRAGDKISNGMPNRG